MSTLKKFDSRRPRTSRGFTVIEATITLLLVAVILSVVAQISNEYARMVKFTSKKDKTILGARIAVDKIRSELEEAIAVIEPHVPGGNPASQLTFRKIDPCNASRLTPSPTPTVWNPSAAAYTLKVKYYVDEGSLFREITFPDNSHDTQSITDGIAGFSAFRRAPNYVELALSFQEETLVRTLTTYVRLRRGM